MKTKLQKIPTTLQEGGMSLLSKKVKEKLKNRLDKIRESKTVQYDILAYRVLRPYFHFHLKRRKNPPRFLFIMSPARSGSTLFAHILGNHPEITGSFEHHTDYEQHADLNNLIYRTAVLNNNFALGTQQYFADKIVWNYKICAEILKDDNVKFIFLLRNPRENLNSMAKFNPEWQNEKKALDYYKERLDNLKNTASKINNPDKCLLVQYHNLVNDTGNTLQELQEFLETDIPFSENYKTSKNTGNIRYGDPSQTIQAGKILRNKKPVMDYFDKKTYDEAFIIYNNCLQQLKKSCA